ncbi:hypothetical protein BC832DRAFT_589986 [Gaertneriomyces semiglobifer]|nr:hypothetical protein BC832DRAFT_589986 [Gaertneriomyces semiglobifer]
MFDDACLASASTRCVSTRTSSASQRKQRHKTRDSVPRVFQPKLRIPSGTTVKARSESAQRTAHETTEDMWTREVRPPNMPEFLAAIERKDAKQAWMKFSDLVHAETAPQESGQQPSALAAGVSQEHCIELIDILSDAEKAREVVAYMVQKRFPIDTAVYNALIGVHARSENIVEAQKVLEEMTAAGVAMDIGTYNMFLRIYAKKDIAQAQVFLARMADEGILPDTQSYTLLMEGACKGTKDVHGPQRVHVVQQFFDEMRDLGLQPDVRAYHALIRVYAEEKDMQTAESWYANMLEEAVDPNLYIYSTLMAGYSRVNEFDKMMSKYHDLKARGLQPNPVIYHILVVAATKNGKLDDAMNLTLDSLSAFEGPQTTPIVDRVVIALCGAGRVADAEEFINKCLPASTHLSRRLYVRLLAAYSKAGSAADVARLYRNFKKAGEMQAPMYAVVMKSAIESRNPELFQQCWKELHDAHLTPTESCYTVALEGFLLWNQVDIATKICYDMVRAGFSLRPLAFLKLIEANIHALRLPAAAKLMSLDRNTASDSVDLAKVIQKQRVGFENLLRTLGKSLSTDQSNAATSPAFAQDDLSESCQLILLLYRALTSKGTRCADHVYQYAMDAHTQLSNSDSLVGLVQIFSDLLRHRDASKAAISQACIKSFLLGLAAHGRERTVKAVQDIFQKDTDAPYLGMDAENWSIWLRVLAKNQREDVIPAIVDMVNAERSLTPSGYTQLIACYDAVILKTQMSGLKKAVDDDKQRVVAFLEEHYPDMVA